MKGFFGNLFDFNHDGKLSGAEQAMDFAAFMNVMKNVNENKEAKKEEDEQEKD